MQNFVEAPKEIYQCTGHFLGMGKYQLLKSEAPHAFKVFKLNRHTAIPSVEHSLPWENTPGAYEKIVDMNFGVCMGHTSAQRKFNVLSFYDSNIPDSIPNRNSDPEKWLEYYQGRIDDVIENKPAIFYGFENLNQLASDPELKPYIKKLIVKQWADNNISFGGLKILRGTKREMNSEAVQKLYGELKEKLDFDLSPRMYFAAGNKNLLVDNKWIHVMQVYKLDPPDADGTYILHIWDPNYSAEYAAQKVKVFSDGTINYNGIELTEIGIVPWEDFEIGEMTGNLIEFCAKHPERCQDIISQ